MVETVTALYRLSLLLVAFGAVASPANAHVLDEYLQSTLVVIEPGDIRLQINLTPGVEIADKVLVQIDRDRDGEVSDEEAAAYAEMLKRDLAVQLDGRNAELKLTASNIPELAELRTGHGIIRMEFAITPDSFTAGQHK